MSSCQNLPHEVVWYKHFWQTAWQYQSSTHSPFCHLAKIWKSTNIFVEGHYLQYCLSSNTKDNWNNCCYGLIIYGMSRQYTMKLLKNKFDLYLDTDHCLYKVKKASSRTGGHFVKRYICTYECMYICMHKHLYRTWLIGWFSHQVLSDSYTSMDCSPLGSSVHGILQARILEWVAISFSNRTWHIY